MMIPFLTVFVMAVVVVVNVVCSFEIPCSIVVRSGGTSKTRLGVAIDPSPKSSSSSATTVTTTGETTTTPLFGTLLFVVVCIIVNSSSSFFLLGVWFGCGLLPLDPRPLLNVFFVVLLLSFFLSLSNYSSSLQQQQKSF